MAMTADGKIATAGHEVHTFGSARDLEHLYELRATADAILCGARTVEETGATLGNGGERFRRRRLSAGLTEYPVRVVVSGSASISPEAEIWKHRFSPIVLFVTSRASAGKLKRLKSLASDLWVSPGDTLDFKSALRWLGQSFSIRRLLVEGGGEVNAALFREGLVDEVHLTICPVIAGGRQAPTIADGVGERLQDASMFQLIHRRQIGDEVFLRYQRIPQ
jgi:riboflavin-specific deaminase-like protein